MASLDSLDQVTLGNLPAVPLSSGLHVIAFGVLELPVALALGRFADSTCVCCTQLSGAMLGVGLS